MIHRLLVVLMLVIASVVAHAVDQSYYWANQSGVIAVSTTQTGNYYWRPLGLGSSSGAGNFTPSTSAASRDIYYYLFTGDLAGNTALWGMVAGGLGAYQESAVAIRLGKGKIKIATGKFEFVPDASGFTEQYSFCQKFVRSFAGSSFYSVLHLPSSAIESNNPTKVDVGDGQVSIQIDAGVNGSGIKSVFTPSSTPVALYASAACLSYGTSYVYETDPNTGTLVKKTLAMGTIIPVFSTASINGLDTKAKYFAVGQGTISGEGTRFTITGSSSARFYFCDCGLYTGLGVTWRIPVLFPDANSPYPCDIGKGTINGVVGAMNFLPSSTQSASTVYQGQYGKLGNNFTGKSYSPSTVPGTSATVLGTGFISIKLNVMTYSATRPLSYAN